MHAEFPVRLGIKPYIFLTPLLAILVFNVLSGSPSFFIVIISLYHIYENHWQPEPTQANISSMCNGPHPLQARIWNKATQVSPSDWTPEQPQHLCCPLFALFLAPRM
ncbi:hypothetical protein C8R44DRAFT_761310 [Mycena epipterygia]|nr:hypothetical protein C8R44DRAFT_761310 [Mycena epipterygia]